MITINNIFHFELILKRAEGFIRQMLWPQYHHCFPEQQTAQIALSNKIMALLTKYRKRDCTMVLDTDEQGNILTKGDIMFCKKHPFVITEEDYIEHYTSGAMDNIFLAPDSEFKALQDTSRKGKNQKSE